MRNKIVLSVILLVTVLGYSQSSYKKIYEYGQYQKGWALVKTNSGNYGFIDADGKTVVAPIYAKIEKFAVNSGEFARVRSVTGNYGLIDRTGKLVVQAIYAEIGDFGQIGKGVALVKSVTGNYGFINRQGIETIKPVLDKKSAIEKLHTLNVK